MQIMNDRYERMARRLEGYKAMIDEANKNNAEIDDLRKLELEFLNE